MYSPVIGSIKVVRSGKVRKAKLYYLRDRKGKSARISEKIKKRIGVDITEAIVEKEIIKKPEIVVKESKVELQKENPAKNATLEIKSKKEELKKKKK